MRHTWRMLRTLPLVLALASLLATTAARADTHLVVPAGGGLAPLDVTVSLADGSVAAGGMRLHIDLEHAQLPSEKDVTVEAVAIGLGKQVVHVVVPAKDTEGVAWEALLAAGRSTPLFAGLTGFVAGDPGERTGREVRVVAGADASFVLVGDIREDLRICGQSSTLLETQALYPSSLELRSATAQRLSPEQQASAQRVVATDVGPGAAPSLAKLLVARGSSVPGSRGLELTDGDPSTAWTERRPGMGQGEFVVMAAPKDVPIARMQVVVTPTAPDKAPGREGAAPRTFYLVTGTETFDVTLPGDAWLKPGEAYEIAFPHPIEASCVALVLNDAYTRGLPHPDVTVAELVAYSEFDAPGATLEHVAQKLGGERGIAAAQVLERAGARALDAARSAYDGLDARGRALAIDVAASHEGCVEAAPLLARGLCERGGEAPRKAREKLERCKGSVAVLASTMRGDASSRACIAPTLAVLAGADALEPIADALAATGDAERETREILRESFAEALKAAPVGRLGALLADGQRSPVGRLEMMRAAGARVVEAPAESDRVLAELFSGARPMRVRYLALGPLGALAHAGDHEAAGRLVEAIARDADWPVRARAAELAAGVPEVQSTLLTAARDPEPRVREAALQALAASPPPGSVDAARAVLATDGWSFVKAQAVGVLSKAPPSGEVDDALRGAMKDASGRVRAAAIVAVALRHTAALHGVVRERLDDLDEDAEVRAAAASALGALCDASSLDRLTELARRLGVPGAEEDE
ncbi:MAG: HEAT repeat domain-containing protein, partial [Polyangiaceae bacterium]